MEDEAFTRVSSSVLRPPPFVVEGNMLLNQSVWWIVPYAVLMLFMVFAMMQFTVALLAKQPPPEREPVDRNELLSRLLALNSPDNPYQLVPGADCDLELHWNPVESSWAGRFARVKLSSVYQARMLFDDKHHQVRWWEMLRTSSFFLGFDGWVPNSNRSWQLQTGYINTTWAGKAYGILPGFPPRIGKVSTFELDTVTSKKRISKVVADSGWTFWPVLWWFQVRRDSNSVLQALLPSALRRISARGFWGILYLASFVVGMGYFALVAEPLDVAAWLWL